MRSVPALAVMISLSACASLGRMPGTSDVQCVRQQMAHGNSYNGPLPFDMAAGHCIQPTGPEDGIVGARYRPLDLRSDPELQRMIEDPALNIPGYPYIPNRSAAPPVGRRWQIVQ
ncbi:hypothetical protein [Asaia spathodeae]|uniref:Uncharacterized protein n=1 Tax=Asaia spathodeae TaxID=657016 RepID=A0ABX2P8K0_9PROT|nr:hypothetical protein [Asaia spathodeae]GBR19923.1 hypothetical protein AA105894_2434 [Asaia spathodeae NBRC 105894]